MNGKIIDSGSPEQIAAKYPYRLYAVKADPMHKSLRHLRAVDGVVSCFSFVAEHHVAVNDDALSAEILLQELCAGGFEHCEVREISPGIEDCFMQLSGNDRQR